MQTKLGETTGDGLVAVITAFDQAHELFGRKILRLAAALKKNCHIIVHASSPIQKRLFLYGGSLPGDPVKTHRAAIEDWVKLVVQPIQEKRPNATFEIIWDNDLTDILAPQLLRRRSRWVVLYSSAESIPRHYLEVTREVQNPVLVMRGREWNSQVRLFAAIDPMHEHDRPQQTDNVICKYAQQLELHMSARLDLGHCYFVPPYLRQHERSIQTIHREALDKYIRERRLQANPRHLLEGETAASLARFIKEKHVDIVILGSIARGLLGRTIVGSTAEKLLQISRHDMLLVRGDHGA